MATTIRIEKLPRIIKSRKRLEKDLNVKISNNGAEVTINGKAEDEYIAEKVILAINLGFAISTAMLLKKEEDYIFEIINIKDYTKRKDLERIRGRIIGTGGGTLATLSQLTKCYFEIKENEIGILGDAEYIKNAQEAIIMLIQGSKQGNVYSFLEKRGIKPIGDLGLKIKG